MRGAVKGSGGAGGVVGGSVPLGNEYWYPNIRSTLAGGSGQMNRIVADPDNAMRFFILNNHCHRSDNNGVSWTDKYTVPGGAAIEGFTYVSTNKYLLGTQINEVYETTDGGDNFALKSTIVAPPTRLKKLFTTAAGSILAGMQLFSGSPIYRSTDGGGTWANISIPSQGGFTPQNVRSFLQNGSGRILFGTTGMPNSNIYYSDDDGATWAVNATDPGLAGGVSDLVEIDNGDILAESLSFSPGDGLSISSDFGATWQHIALGAYSINYILNITGSVCLGFVYNASGEENYYLAVSRDNGRSWTYMLSLVDDGFPARNRTAEGNLLLFSTFTNVAMKLNKGRM